MKSSLFLVIIAGSLAISSCKSNPNQDQEKMLVGKWNVVSSEMNNRPNGFMKDGYFVFHDDKTVDSNLFDNNFSHQYHVEQEHLKINTIDQFNLKISKLTADSMVLEGKMKMFYMKYILTKSKLIQ